MRIAHVGVEIVPTAPGAFVGGLVKNVATIGRAQRGRGHDVHVFTSDVQKRLDHTGATEYGQLHPVPTYGTYGGSAFATTFMVRIVRALRRVHTQDPFDIVHVHSAYASLGAIDYPIRGLGVPTIFSLYSPNFRAIPGHDCNGSARMFGRALARRCLAPADVTVVPSANLVSRLRSLGFGDGSLAQIPPALAPTMTDGLPTKEAARSSLGLADGGPVVLYLGNYSPWKGIEVLLEAMARVRRRLPDVRLLTAWGEPYEWPGNRREAILSRIRDLKLEGLVHQVGIVPDVRLLLRAADAMASPFLCTCKVLDYPLSILEAMACGTPVISTSVGGIPELLDRGRRGFEVQPGSGEDLAQALVGVLRDSDTARGPAVEAARWVRDRFSADRVTNELCGVYEALGAQGSPGASVAAESMS